MKAKQRLTDLDTYRVDLVDRGAVRDPENPTDTERFLMWKSESAPKENRRMNDATKKFAAALAKAADGEAALDELIGKAEDITAEKAATLKGAFRLLRSENPDLSVDEFAKATGLVKGDVPSGDDVNYGVDSGGNALKPHAFSTKDDKADMTCAECGQGGTARVHTDFDEGESGSQTVETSEKEETAKSEAEPVDLEKAMEALPENVRAVVKSAMDAAREREETAKAEQIRVAKAEMLTLCKDELGHLPGIATDELAEQLYELKVKDEAAYNALLPTLKSSSAAIKASAALGETGKDGSGRTAGDLKTQHEAIAQGIVKSEGVSIQKARSLAWERNPHLQRQYNEAKAEASK